MTKNNTCHYFSSMPGHYSVMTTGVNWVWKVSMRQHIFQEGCSFLWSLPKQHIVNMLEDKY